jgi:plastocyanin
MARRITLATTMLVLTFASGLMVALPTASAAVSTVAVSIPSGAASGAAAAPGYAPATINIVIGVNNTVMWTNDDGAPHTVTPSTVPAGASWSVGSGNLVAGASYSFTFTVPGTYTYACAYHSWMTGTVVVKAATSTTATSTTTSTTPEFPTAALALVFFAVIAAVMLAVPRLRPSRGSSPSI